MKRKKINSVIVSSPFPSWMSKEIIRPEYSMEELARMRQNILDDETGRNAVNVSELEDQIETLDRIKSEQEEEICQLEKRSEEQEAQIEALKQERDALKQEKESILNANLNCALEIERLKQAPAPVNNERLLLEIQMQALENQNLLLKLKESERIVKYYRMQKRR